VKTRLEVSRRISSLPEVSHTNTHPTLLPEATRLPSGVKTAPHNEPRLSAIEACFAPDARFHRRTLPKSTDMSSEPSGEKAASLGLLACPRSVTRSFS